MVWLADIYLKSGKNVIVDNLVSVNEQSGYDSSISKITDFSTYHLTNGQRLTFIGDPIVSLLSDGIDYVQFVEHN